MKKLIWLSLVIATLVTSLFLVVDVNASTPLSGTITQDTTWTQANSPYTLTGSVTVNPGITLTLEPGTTVDLASYSLIIGGTLNAEGTIDNRIVFQTSYYYYSVRVQFSSTSTIWNPTASTGCIVENAIFNSVTITISNSSPKISNNYFTNNQLTSLSVSGGSPLIVNNAFDTRATCIAISNGYSGSPTISGNFIKSSGGGNNGISCGNNVFLSNNNITGCYVGIYVTGNATITRNLVTSNTFGLMTSVNSATIEGNTFANNTIGINGGGIIRNNTLGNNQVGLMDLNLNNNITQNNFFGNIKYNFQHTLTTSIDAPYNWWGTTDATVINQTIYDYKNSTTLGTVNFSPYLNESNPQAPPIQNINLVPAPTPTPYPTPIPVPTITQSPRPTATYAPISSPTPTPESTATPIPTPTPPPTPSPTPKIMPGSPLSLGGTSFAEAISQFDITAIAELVLMALGIVWLTVILFYVNRDFFRKENKKPKDK